METAVSRLMDVVMSVSTVLGLGWTRLPRRVTE